MATEQFSKVWKWNQSQNDWLEENGLEDYGVASIIRLLQIMGLFCRIYSLL